MLRTRKGELTGTVGPFDSSESCRFVDPRDDLIPMTAVCELIGGKETPIAPSTVYKAIKRGDLPPPIKLGPGTSRWRRSEILQFLELAAAQRFPNGRAA